MKFYISVFLLICFCCGSTFAVPAAEEGQGAAAATVNAKELTIAVASDLHLDPINIYTGAVNPLVAYNMDITDALLFDAIRQDADLLLLCGDVTNAGNVQQHEALVEKLKEAKAKELQTYVLPGNHDIGEVNAEMFSELYADFGYSEAYSRDTDSLSYSLLLDELLILMLDTDGYSGREDGAYVSKLSLAWIEDQLKMADSDGLQVLAVGHYTLLTGQTTEFFGQEALIDLLETHHVPLYICGHLHQRNVTSGKGLTELVVDQATGYPCSYALIYREGVNDYRYSPKRIDVSAWAKETGQTAEELLNFYEYEENLFDERCEQSIQLLKGKQFLSEEDTEQAIAFFKQVQREYLLGTLPDHRDEIYEQQGYKAFMQIAANSTYGKWIPVFLANAGPYTAGFVLKEGQISS